MMKMIKMSSIALVMFLAGVAVAQPRTPQLGVDHLVRIEMVKKLEQAAQQACQQLSVTQNFVQAQKETTEKIEFDYKGWTLDWRSNKLVEKKKD